MAEYNLGTARGTIEIDYNGSGAAQAQAGLGQVARSADSSHEAVKKVGTGFTVAGASIVAGLGVAVKSAADFEKGLSGIQAVSGASASEMETVRKKALQLGADTAFSASDASSAIEELVKAGISIPDVMNGAADATVALAAAGGVELPEAATIASNAMNQFGLSAKELPGIADKIAGAANASAIDVSDLGNSMSQVGAVAHLAGLSFDDTALAITAMGNAGIKGSDAGTSLKTFLSNLQPTTDKAAAAMEDLGIITKDGANQFYDATGKIKPMNQIAGVLQKSLKGMSEAQKQAALQTLFGSDAIRAAAVIADEGSAGMDKLTKSIDKVKAADVAETRMKNMSGQIEQLKGSAETLAIGLGSVLIPALTGIVKNLTQVVNWFSNLDSGTQKAIVLIAAFAGGLLLFIGTLVKLVQFAQGAKAAMLALNGTFLANPVFLIIMAIIALVAAIILLWKNSETFRNIVTKAWEGVKNAVKAVADWFTGTLVPWFKGVWDSISSGATSLWQSLVSVWTSIQTSVATIWGAVASFFTTTWNNIKTVTSTVWGAIASFFSAVWSGIVAVVTTYINIVVAIITTYVKVILAIWNAVWGLFGPLVKAVWDLITAIVEVGLAWLKVGITKTLNAIKKVWETIWGAIKDTAATIWNAIKTAVGAVLGVLKTIITTYFNVYKTIILAVWNALKTAAGVVWNGIKTVITAVLNVLKSVISSIWNGIKAVITSVMNTIKSIISAIWGTIGGTVKGAVNSIKSTVSSVFNSVKSIVSSIFNSIVSSIRGRMNSAKGAVSSVVSSIKGIFSGAGGWLYNSGQRLIQGLIDGIRSMINAAANAISGVADRIRGFLPGSPIKEGPLRQHGWNEGRPGKYLVDLVANGIDSDLQKINRAFGNLDPQLPSSLTAPEIAVSASGLRTVGTGSTPLPAVPPTPREVNVEYKVYNPVAEKTSETAVKETTRMAALGVFG